ncbi:MAG TPA: 30S ribosomal protein S12 methylthiotransferase RimO [bacterium]|nr:30S ribosomal protein S12 methylthiotransferase RimO [bacterium]
MKQNVRIGMVSLGCPKNLVDSELMLGQLAQHQYEVTADPSDAEVLIVNTCGFIDKARRESVDTILEMAEYKRKGSCRKLLVTGCLVQGYGEEMKRELPEVDAFLGSADYAGIAQVVKGLLGDKRDDDVLLKVSNPVWLYDSQSPRLLSTPPYMAYLKIAEGCDHACAFCAIPNLRGRMRSRPVEDILVEARALAARGVKELNVISQDTSEYGRDLYGKPHLKELMQGLAGVEGLRWVRLHYLYPAYLDDALMDVMAREERLAKYVDLPLQHGDDAMLKAMRRPGTRGGNLALLERFRKRVPGAALRSSFIVGYPGETEAQFESLLSFLEEAQLDRVGVFSYSQEALTPSGGLDGQVAEKVKERRRKLVMRAASALSEKRLRRHKGSVLDVMVERPSRGADTAVVDSVEHGALAPERKAPGFRRSAKDLWVGRTQWDAPDIDGKVYFSPLPGAVLKPGDFVRVLIEQSTEHDLVGSLQ